MPNLPDGNCEKCQLFQTCKSPYMKSNGADDPVVLLIGEAPGEIEDREGIPFVGRSGRLLRQTLSEFFHSSEVRFTNIVRCRPPDNKITKKAIKCCEHNVLDEIDQYDPDIVLLLGNVPLHAILGEAGITTWNGAVIERDDRIYVPLYHPAYILRNRAAMDEWLKGFFSAEEALAGDVKRDNHEYIFPTSIEDVEKMESHLANYGWVAFDTETASLDAHAANATVLACSLAAGDKAYAIPLGHHQQPSWGKLDGAVEFGKVISIIHRILTSHKVVGHNIKFDQQQWFAYTDLWFDAHGDTMLASHLLDSRKGRHGLKRLAGLHLGMYDYDEELKRYCSKHPDANIHRGGTYAAVPLDILLPYAGMDAAATYSLKVKLHKELSKKQRCLLEEMIMPASTTLARVEDNGIGIDKYIADRYVRIYSHAKQELWEDIADDADVQRMVTHTQADWDAIHKLHPRRKRKVFQFNPNSPVQLRELYYTYSHIPVPAETTKTGLPTTKADVLSKHESAFPIITLIRYYKLFTKMLGTYLIPAAYGKWASDDDGRVRCNYNLHGTVTGRLSSSEPNLQNIPTPEKEPGTLLAHLPIKNIFRATFPNGVLMSADYAGMELRVFASLADCKAMLDVHKGGEDFHKMVASMVSGIPYNDIDKPTRYIYKWTNWTMLYGGGASTLHNMYDIPMSEAKHSVEAYLDRFPEVLDYQDYVTKFTKKHGYMESPFGRQEYFPYINDRNPSRAAKARRSAINMPVQSAASDITLMALVFIDRALFQDGYESIIVNTVHDSIVLDVHPDEVDDIANMCVSVMENVVELAKFYMPSIDLSWLKCPLKADIEVGTHYGCLVPYEEWKKGDTT